MCHLYASGHCPVPIVKLRKTKLQVYIYIYFFVVTMFLCDKSYTVWKPDHFPFIWCYICEQHAMEWAADLSIWQIVTAKDKQLFLPLVAIESCFELLVLQAEGDLPHYKTEAHHHWRWCQCKETLRWNSTTSNNPISPQPEIKLCPPTLRD